MTTTNKTIINFGPGPAKIPPEVLAKAQHELCNYANTGMSLMELSHRGKEFAALLQSVEQSLSDLLSLPDDYKVLLLHGGGVGQFSAVPLNLLGLKEGKTADYFVTGSWSALAAEEAKKYGGVNLVYPKRSNFTGIEEKSGWTLNSNASYLYYCDNETIHGVEFPFVPESSGVPIVCDMSSNFLSRPFDIKKFGVVFAGAQKNLGCAGLAVVIVRKDLIGHSLPHTPAIWDYGKQVAADSCINTPPMFNIYILSLVLNWVKENGGLEGMKSRNERKSTLIYDVVDQSQGFYTSPVCKTYRSMMNIPLHIEGKDGKPDTALEQLFLKEATRRGLLHLNGHRSVGGLRVSLYNAVTVEETQILVEFMKEFQRNNKGV